MTFLISVKLIYFSGDKVSKEKKTIIYSFMSYIYDNNVYNINISVYIYLLV